MPARLPAHPFVGSSGPRFAAGAFRCRLGRSSSVTWSAAMSSDLRQAKVRADGRGSPPWNSDPDAALKGAGAWFRPAGAWRPLSRCSNRLFRPR